MRTAGRLLLAAIDNAPAAPRDPQGSAQSFLQPTQQFGVKATAGMVSKPAMRLMLGPHSFVAGPALGAGVETPNHQGSLHRCVRLRIARGCYRRDAAGLGYFRGEHVAFAHRNSDQRLTLSVRDARQRLQLLRV